jgi:type III pantothenate kinase
VSGTVVVDVGNTRIKWGRAAGPRVTTVAALPPDDPAAWGRQYQRWRLDHGGCWLVSGVHPGRRTALLDWLRPRAASVHVLDSYRQLPLVVEVDHPEQVGLDRLLNAVAANSQRPANVGAILVDAGSAITVDLVDEHGVFRGGAILPGLRLMAQALHDHTARLPLVEIRETGELPGRSTVTAIQAGVLHAAVGGIERLIATYRAQRPGLALEVFFTGGDAPLLASGQSQRVQLWPEMTLEGLLHGLRPGAADG